MARFRADRLSGMYFLVPRSVPGTIRWGIVGNQVIMLGPEGTGEYLDSNLNDASGATWTIDEDTGVLRLVRENPSSVEGLVNCPGGQVRRIISYPQVDILLLSESAAVDFLRVTQTPEVSFPDGLPEDCAPPELGTNTVNWLAFKSGAGELPFSAEELEGRTLSFFRHDDLSPNSNPQGVIADFAADGEGTFTLWAALRPEDGVSEEIEWSVDDGRLVVTEMETGDRHTYHRLQRDGSGAELLYAVFDRGAERRALSWITTDVDPSLVTSDPLDFLGEWVSAGELSWPRDEPFGGAIRVRMCNDTEPTEANTGPLFGTGFQLGVNTNFEVGGGNPQSWGFDENDNFVQRAYLFPGQGAFSYCDLEAQQLGCYLFRHRAWLPVLRVPGIVGDRLYVIEELAVSQDMANAIPSTRLNWYELTSCAPSE